MMCFGIDSFDIVLFVYKIDICEFMYDGDLVDFGCQQKFDFGQIFVFENF